MCSCIENMCNRLNRLVFIPPPTSLAASRPRPGPPEAEYFQDLALCCQILNVVQSLSGPFVPVSDSFQWHYVTLNVRSLVFLPPPKKPGGINVCQIVNVFQSRPAFETSPERKRSAPFVPVSDSFQWHYVNQNIHTSTSTSRSRIFRSCFLRPAPLVHGKRICMSWCQQMLYTVHWDYLARQLWQRILEKKFCMSDAPLPHLVRAFRVP